MVGLVARYGTKVVIVTAPTQGAAEEIALQLFAECGHDLKGIEIPMVMFDPTETGGMVVDPTDPLDDTVDPMEDWNVDGYMGPTGPA